MSDVVQAHVATLLPQTSKEYLLNCCLTLTVALGYPLITEAKSFETAAALNTSSSGKKSSTLFHTSRGKTGGEIDFGNEGSDGANCYADVDKPGFIHRAEVVG